MRGRAVLLIGPEDHPVNPTHVAKTKLVVSNPSPPRTYYLGTGALRARFLGVFLWGQWGCWGP